MASKNGKKSKTQGNSVEIDSLLNSIEGLKEGFLKVTERTTTLEESVKGFNEKLDVFLTTFSNQISEMKGNSYIILVLSLI